MKVARFTTVVAKCGRPAWHLTWAALAKDAPLSTALAANRVMTIHQAGRGGQSDFGTIGFTKGPRTQILIFPKSLRRFAEDRVVGINYDLLDTAQTLVAATEPPRRKGSARKGKSIGEVVAFAPEPTPAPPRDDAPATPRKVAPSPPPVEEKPPLTWEEALQELEAIRHRLRGKSSEVADRLADLAARVRERLKPH